MLINSGIYVCRLHKYIFKSGGPKFEIEITRPQPAQRRSDGNA